MHNKERIIRATREAPRSYISNFWVPKVFMGKANLDMLSIYLFKQFKEEERNVLIIVDSNLEKYAIRVSEYLNKRGFKCQIWKGVVPEVPFDTVKQGLNICNELNPQVLIAIGGGSAIDTAKLIFLLHEQPDINLYNIMPQFFFGLRKKIKTFIAIPTTSGTGSEATYSLMFKDTSKTPPKKINITSIEILPDVVILSYEFVKNLPPYLTAGTGIDALVHAISAYLSPCYNTLSDYTSLEALRLVLKFLLRAYKRGNDTEAREKMQMAAFLAGLAMITSGVALEHSMGHSLGNLYPIHHGVAVGIFTSYIIQFFAQNSSRYIDIAQAFGVEIMDRPNQEILKELIEKYKEFLHSLNLPTSIKDCRKPLIEKENFLKNLDQLIEHTWEDIITFASLRIPNKEELKRLFIYAYEGTNVDF